MANAKAKISDSSLKQLEQILANKKKYVIRQTKQERRELGNDPTLEELFLFVQTMAKDLKKMGILG